MSPLDDELRNALQRAAESAPDSTHIDAGSVERRARGMRQRRTSIALGASVAVAAVAAISVASLGGSGSPSSEPLTSGGTDGIVATTSPPSPSPFVSSDPTPPSPTPTAGADVAGLPSAVDQWGFRGDAAVRDRSLSQFAAAYATYRSNAADKLTESEYLPIYAGIMANQSGDVISILVRETGRISRVATAVLTEGGTQIVGDQPVGPTTTFVDVLLPADPANLILAITSPGPDEFLYELDNDVTYAGTTNGVAEFGRSLESKGGTSDHISLRRFTGTKHAAGSKWAPVIDGNSLGRRAPGQFHPDPSQPGRLSSPLAAAQFVLTAWEVGDMRTTDKYTTLSGRTALAQQHKDEVGTDIINDCDQEDPTSSHCMFASKDDRYKGLTFIMEGTPSIGFKLRAIGNWIA